jgi:hypothetical protein
MNKIIKKVDGVKSIIEALELQKLGVDLIGVFINSDLAFGNEVIVDKATIIAIKGELEKSKLVGVLYMPFDDEAILALIDEVEFDYIQIVGHILPSVFFRKELQKRRIGIIYSGIAASYDDDPTWILSRYVEKSDLNVSYYHVNFLGEVSNSWNFTKNKSPQYPDELQLADIIELASNYPLLITYDFSVDNIKEIVDQIPTIKGISMMIAEKSEKNNEHILNYSSVVAVLNKLSE